MGNDSNNQVVSGTFHRRIFPSKKPKKIFFGVCAILAVVIVVVLLFHNSKQNKNHVNKETYSVLAPQALSDIRSGKYAQAQQLITSTASNSSEKDTLQLLALSYIGQRKYDQALSTYQEILQKYGPDVGTYKSLGQMEQNLGNKSMAISYYQKAIVLLQKESDTTSQQQVSELQSLINYLQK